MSTRTSSKRSKRSTAPVALDWSAILAEIPVGRRREVRAMIEKNYSDVVTTNHPVVETGCEDGNGRPILRFKRDPMTCWLANHVSIEAMVKACQSDVNGVWSRQKIEDFYRDKGYTLCGFTEVFRSWPDHWRSGSSAKGG